MSITTNVNHVDLEIGGTEQEEEEAVFISVVNTNEDQPNAHQAQPEQEVWRNTFSSVYCSKVMKRYYRCSLLSSFESGADFQSDSEILSESLLSNDPKRRCSRGAAAASELQGST